MSISTVFDYIVVTAPSENIAKVYESQLALLQLDSALLNDSRIFCVADVKGKRMGSGGGTLHAIQELIHKYEVLDFSYKRTLVVHSGGDSRRAPFCSVTGKAWLNMNISPDGVNVANPLLLLIKELSHSLQYLRIGSLVVACSDVLLKLAPDLKFEKDGVYIVSVPAVVSTAVNHGVLVCKSFASAFQQQKELLQPETLLIDAYLQKPSITELESYAATFNHRRNEEASTFIDTGVVVFVGAALSAIINFRGGSPSEKFELYSELLLACKTFSKTASFPEYLDQCGVNLNDCMSSKLSLLESLWQSFSKYDLYGVIIPFGSFTHLGTSREIYQFLLMEEQLSSSFDLQRSIQSICDPDVSQLIMVGSFGRLVSSMPTTLSIFSEYSVLSDPQLNSSNLSLTKHNNSKFVLSHLYPSVGSKIPIASDFMLQQTFLRNGDDCSMAILLLHLSDDVKSQYLNPKATVWGMQWEKVFKITNCVSSDIWDDGDDQCLWNAKLFCYAEVDPDCSNHLDDFITWPLTLHHADEEVNENIRNSIIRWKNSPRLALSKIILHGDATSMFHWRMLLKACYEHISTSTTNQSFENSSAHIEILHKLWCTWYARMNLAFDNKFDSNKSIKVWLTFFLIGRYYRNLGAVDTSSKINISSELQNLICDMLEIPVDADIFSTCNMVQFSKCWEILLKVIELSKISANLTSITFLFLRSILHSCGRNVVHDTICKLLKFGYHLNPEEQPRLLFQLYSLMPDIRGSTDECVLNKQPKLLPVNQDCENHSKSVHLKSLYQSIFIGDQSILGKNCESKDAFEKCIQLLIQGHVVYSLHHAFLTKFPSILRYQHPFEMVKSGYYNVCLCRSPVRIDIAGGWSDTPPICYDQHGAVCNVAVKVNGEHPLKCAAQIFPVDDSEKPFIRLRSYTRQNDDVSERKVSLIGEQYFYTWEDLQSLSLSSPCALIQACLLVYKLDQYCLQFANSKPLSDILNDEFAGSIDISSYSNLPSGSGMGGSSILAAAILKSIDLLFLKCDSNLQKEVGLTNEMLIYFVSQVEQRLTTGGGWQDQIGGNYPGFKIGRSLNGLPLTVDVEEIPVTKEFLKQFEKRTYLIYTGQQRLAKNTLLNALKNYSVICSTVSLCEDISNENCPTVGRNDRIDIVQSLIRGAEGACAILKDSSSKHHCLEEIDCDIDKLAEVLTSYWNLKVSMAPGSDPPFVRSILGKLKEYCSGYALCGAGAGGFAVIVLKSNVSSDFLHRAVAQMNESANIELSIHSVEVDNAGLQSTVIDNSEKKVPLFEYF